MKECNKCKLEKDYSEFTKCKASKDGYYSTCKVCRYGYNPHKPKLEGLKMCIGCKEDKDISCFSKNHKGHSYMGTCKTCRNRNQELKRKDTSKYKIRKNKLSYRSKLKVKYGIDIHTYNKMLKEQNNICKICKNPETQSDNLGNLQRLSVDHCHSTGLVRGLLCSSCNKALGGFKDKVELLKQAIQYLLETNTDKS